MDEGHRDWANPTGRAGTATQSNPQAVSSKAAIPIAELRVALQRGLIATLGDVYDCTRVWSAWSYGTMDANDFAPVLDRLDELIDELVFQIAAIPCPKCKGEGFIRRNGWPFGPDCDACKPAQGIEAGAPEYGEGLIGRIVGLEAGLRRIEHGDYPRDIASYWRKDGKPCRHDQCVHGQSMWQECGDCCANFAAAVLAQGTPTQRAETTGSVGEADGGPVACDAPKEPHP